MAFRSMKLLLQSLPKINLTRQPLLLRNNFFQGGCANFSKPHPSVISGINPLLQRQFHLLSNNQMVKPLLLSPQKAQANTTQLEQTRTIIKFSIRRGRRKTVKAVLRRFYRLDWGIWIHPKSGRSKKLWKKGKLRRKRLRQHVFCNAWQTRTLERMTTKYWHKKKYWVDDPYESYHTRDNYWITKNTKNIVHQLD